MNRKPTKSQVSVSRLDSDRTEIAFGSEGIAGCTPLRADCGVVVHVDNFDPGRLVRLTVTHDEDELWPIETQEFINHITGVDAEDSFHFAKIAPEESPSLPRSVSLLALTKNQVKWLSPVYGLDALQIRDLHPDLFDISDQLIERGLRELKTIVRRSANPSLGQLVSRLQTYRDGVAGVTRSDVLGSLSRTGHEPDLGRDFVPPYPAPRGNRALGPDSAVEVLDFDIDHHYVDRAWWTVDATETNVTIHAASQFPDIRVYAEIREKGSGSRRVDRFELSLDTSRDGDFFTYVGRTVRDKDREATISIHASSIGEESTRSHRMKDFLNRTMAAVAAKLHALGPDVSLDTLKRSDPSLRNAVEMVETLSIWASGESPRAAQCSQLLSADRIRNIEGFGFVSDYSSLVWSIRETSSQNDVAAGSIPDIDDASAWSVIHVLDRINLERVDLPLWSTTSSDVTGFSNFQYASRIESTVPLSQSHQYAKRPDRRWLFRARRPLIRPADSRLGWLRFMSELNLVDSSDGNDASEREVTGSKSSTGMQSRRGANPTSPDPDLLWRLRIGQLGL